MRSWLLPADQAYHSSVRFRREGQAVSVRTAGTPNSRLSLPNLCELRREQFTFLGEQHGFFPLNTSEPWRSPIEKLLCFGTYVLELRQDGSVTWRQFDMKVDQGITMFDVKGEWNIKEVQK